MSSSNHLTSTKKNNPGIGKTTKKTTVIWKIWLALVLAMLVGTGIGIAVLVLTKALALLTSALTWLAPFFIVGLLGAVLLTQVVAVFILFRSNLEKDTRRALLWLGVYSLPLSGAGLTLLLAYTAFNTIGTMPLFWAGLVGFTVGFLVAGLVFYKLSSNHQTDQSKRLTSTRMNTDAVESLPATQPKPSAAPASNFQSQPAPPQPVQQLTVWDYAEEKNFDAKKFFTEMAKRIEFFYQPENNRAKPPSTVMTCINIFNQESENASKITSKREILTRIGSTPFATVRIELAVICYQDERKDFFIGVDRDILELLKEEYSKLAKRATEGDIIKQGDSDGEAVRYNPFTDMQRAAFNYLNNSLEDILSTALSPPH